MAQPWKYAQNQFLRVSARNRRRLFRISRDHTAKLISKVGSPPDALLQSLIDRTLPLEDDYELKIIQWEIVSGTRKGQTDVLEELLGQLSGEKIRTWDVAIQNIFPQGSQQHTQLLPKGRTPFNSGPRDDRIFAVRTLSIGLQAFEELASLQTSVAAFHQTLETARTTQQGSEGDITTASQAIEPARQALAIMLYRNVGLLMDRLADNPLQLEEYFELALLRVAGGGSATPSGPPDNGGVDTTFLMNWTQSGETTVTAWLRMPDDGSVDPAAVTQIRLTEGAATLTTAVNLQAGQSQQIVWEGVTVVDGIDEAVLLDAEGNVLAEGVRDETLPDPGP